MPKGSGASAALLEKLEDSMEDAEKLVEAKASSAVGSAAVASEEESKCYRTLKRSKKGASVYLAQLLKEMREVKAKLSELSPKLNDLKKQRLTLLKGTAANHLTRVGAPDAVVAHLRFGLKACSEPTMLAICELDAAPPAFDACFEELRQSGGASWEPWSCTPAAARRQDRDLLGMCPGGKPHLSGEMLEARGETRCFCDICVIGKKIKTLQNEVVPLKARLEELKEDSEAYRVGVCAAAKLLRLLRCDEEVAEFVGDPVFFGDDRPFEPTCERDEVAHRRAQCQWDQVAETLSAIDLPLRVVFLDKSGSMAGDAVTYDALALGLQNSLNPTKGSTLTFLFAAPGDTQIFFRRPGDEPIGVEIELGAATWFNEPVVRALQFLARSFEKLDIQKWTKSAGEPPLQVLCLTDGEDNVSPGAIRSLDAVVEKIKDIRAPASGKKLYVPMAGPLPKSSTSTTDSFKIPVWMVWIAVGLGGRRLAASDSPKEICMVDAVATPCFREILEEAPFYDSSTPLGQASQEMVPRPEGKTSVDRKTHASQARRRMSAARVDEDTFNGQENLEASRPSWSIGHRIRARSGTVGGAPRSGIILDVGTSEGQEQEYSILFDDEHRGTVAGSDLLGAPVQPSSLLKVGRAARARCSRTGQCGVGVEARQAEPAQQRLQVLSLVDAATNDLATVMETYDPRSGCIPLETAMASISTSSCSGEVDVESALQLEAKVGAARSGLTVSFEVDAPPRDPTQVLLEGLSRVGCVGARMLPEDRLVAQRFVGVAIEIMMYGGSVMPEHLLDQLGCYVDIAQERAQRRMLSEGDMEAWYVGLVRPARRLLEVLVELELLEAEQTADGIEFRARQESRPCLLALWRFFAPAPRHAGSEDALRRAVSRMQRLRPLPSFVKEVPTVRQRRPSVPAVGPSPWPCDTGPAAAAELLACGGVPRPGVAQLSPWSRMQHGCAGLGGGLQLSQGEDDSAAGPVITDMSGVLSHSLLQRGRPSSSDNAPQAARRPSSSNPLRSVAIADRSPYIGSKTSFAVAAHASMSKANYPLACSSSSQLRNFGLLVNSQNKPLDRSLNLSIQSLSDTSL